MAGRSQITNEYGKHWKYSTSGEYSVFHVNIANPIPFKIPAGVDLIVSCESTNAAGTGPATCVLRGWVVTE